MKREHIEAVPRVAEIAIGFFCKSIAVTFIIGGLSTIWIDWRDSKRRNVQIKRKERR